MSVASPRALRLRTPSWLDTRFVVGVLLVLASVVVGARVLAAADRAEQVYAAARDLAPGTTIDAADLRIVRVRLFDTGQHYVRALAPGPVGYTLLRPLAHGELVPRDALVTAPPAAIRLVTVPVAPHHFPAGLAHGDRVDVYLSPKTRTGAVGPPALLLAAVPVEAVDDAGGARLGAGGDAGVVLRVPAGQVPAAVRAVEGGAVDLVRVPASAPAGALP